MASRCMANVVCAESPTTNSGRALRKHSTLLLCDKSVLHAWKTTAHENAQFHQCSKYRTAFPLKSNRECVRWSVHSPHLVTHKLEPNLNQIFNCSRSRRGWACRMRSSIWGCSSRCTYSPSYAETRDHRRAVLQPLDWRCRKRYFGQRGGRVRRTYWKSCW